MEEQAFSLEHAGYELHGIVTLPEAPGPRPTVIICHGFKGFQEWGFFPKLATLLAERGFTAIRFNFYGSGMEPGDELVTDLEAFRTATIGRDVDDLLRVVDAAGTEVAAGRVDRDRLGLLGHSRGGGTALLAAAELGDRLRALVTWSAVSTFDRLIPDHDAWREAGEITIVNGRTGQEMAIGVEVLEDLLENVDRYDLLAAAGRLTAPWLIVHGAADETVPPSEGRLLHQATTGACEHLEIEGASHTFGAQHPFAGPTPELVTALNATQSWFRKWVA